MRRKKINYVPTDFQSKLVTVLDMLRPVGDDGGLLIHPDGSAHLIDDTQDDCMFFDDVFGEIDDVCDAVEAWARASV